MLDYTRLDWQTLKLIRPIGNLQIKQSVMNTKPGIHNTSFSSQLKSEPNKLVC
jgi:hypothetical protein